VSFRTYLGLDIAAGELRATALRRKGRGAVLSGGKSLTLSQGIVVPSLRKPIIRKLEDFSAALREVLAPLAGREDRVAVSLPDISGQVFLTRIEGRFKSKSEGIEILKWQIKNSLPMDVRDLQIDFQVLGRNEAGQSSVIVSVVTRPVLHQVEEVLSAMGYNAVVVDFQSLNLYNYYRSRVNMGKDFILVGLNDNNLNLQYFRDSMPAFYRSCLVDPAPETVFREIHRTLIAGQSKFQRFRKAAAFLHCDWQARDEVKMALSSLFDGEIVHLDPHLERMAPASPEIVSRKAGSLVPAVGAAERMMAGS